MLFIITGTSSGIGLALAEACLEKGHEVIGIARRNHLNHANFTFIACDLTDTIQLEKLDFSTFMKNSNTEVVLVNNAGVISKIDYTENLSFAHFHKLNLVNITALQWLTSLFLKQVPMARQHSIVHISSGAAQRPIPAWSAYCSSKAAVDMFALTLKEEFKEKGQTTKVYAIAPGVVDTGMQEDIRAADKTNFSSSDKFKEMKRSGDLIPPRKVAVKLLQWLEKPQQDVITRFTY